MSVEGKGRCVWRGREMSGGKGEMSVEGKGDECGGEGRCVWRGREMSVEGKGR